MICTLPIFHVAFAKAVNVLYFLKVRFIFVFLSINYYYQFMVDVTDDVTDDEKKKKKKRNIDWLRCIS